MSRSADPGHFFQTSDAIAAGERRAAKSKNKLGDPIDLKVKILAVLAWHPVDVDLGHAEGSIVVACADGLARLVDLKKRKVIRTYAGASAPLTSLAFQAYWPRRKSDIVFAGCWDKTIHSWSALTGQPLRRYAGHTDFVKSIVCTVLEDKDILISGGADATIIVWDVDTGAKLYQIKSHARAVLSLDVQQMQSPAQTKINIFSADSVRDVRHFELRLDGFKELLTEPIVVHETSVNKIHATPDEDGVGTELWTSSSDKTAKHLVHREKWEIDTVLEHPDFVKDTIDCGDQVPYIATACRDGGVRIWDPSSGKLLHLYDGHFDEVTGLAWGADSSVVSVSLDGTIRTWKTGQESIAEAARLEQKATDPAEAIEEKKGNAMTAEEEAELAELLDSD